MTHDDRAQERCALCDRVPRRGTTRHHLIPRTCHRNKWFRKRFDRAELARTIDLCHDCHRAVHRFVPSEKLLGREYRTLESLRAHAGIAEWLEWARRQR